MNPHAPKPRSLLALAAAATLLLAPALGPALGPDLAPAVASAFGGELLAQPRVSVVHGAEIRILQRPEGELRGELLALGPDRVWILSDDAGVRSALLTDIRRVDMTRHGFGSKRLFTWTAAAAGVTGGAMLIACSSVEDMDGSCEGFALGWVAVWALVGGISYAALRPTRRMEPHALEDLRPWARFPQGIPADFQLAAGGPR